MAELRLEHVSKSFAPSSYALEDISLTVQPGECLTVVGPSGCGKTTLLRIIAGLEQPNSGEIRINGQCVNHEPCHQRCVSMLFQRPALIPHQTIQQNLTWLLGPRFSETDLRQVAQALGLEHKLDQPVGQLSGGEQQRVALGRCLLRKATLYLLDEPLSHLDAPLRTEVRRQVCTLLRKNAATILWVTHDPGEALSVGDRVAVLNQGGLVQLGEPAELLRQPRHRFVAELVHHDRGGLNCLRGVLDRKTKPAALTSDLVHWHSPSPPVPWDSQILLGDTQDFRASTDIIHIIIGVPVDEIACSGAKSRPDDLIQVRMVVVRQEFSAGGTWVTGRDRGLELMARAEPGERFVIGQEVTMTFSIRAMYGFDRSTGLTLWTPTG